MDPREKENNDDGSGEFDPGQIIQTSPNQVKQNRIDKDFDWGDTDGVSSPCSIPPAEDYNNDAEDTSTSDNESGT